MLPDLPLAGPTDGFVVDLLLRVERRRDARLLSEPGSEVRFSFILRLVVGGSLEWGRLQLILMIPQCFLF